MKLLLFNVIIHVFISIYSTEASMKFLSSSTPVKIFTASISINYLPTINIYNACCRIDISKKNNLMYTIDFYC